MDGKNRVELEVVGVFGTITIKNSLDYNCDNDGYLTVEAGDDGTVLGHDHEYVFNEWYYIRIITK